jgi:tRNA pseudouridine synthase 10
VQVINVNLIFIGTYIKEFVHGDLERTLPNFGTLIGKKVDILQLDVGSLKEGNWEKGDDLKMKLDNFDWKNE